MGAANKLLLPFRGVPIIRHVVDTVQSAPVEDIVVVTGHEAERVRGTLAGADVRLVHNPDYASGMASSLRRGVEAAASDTSGFMIVLGDLPLLRPSTLVDLTRHFANGPPEAILIPTHESQRGHPVIFAVTYREELLQLEGDVGARSVIEAHPEQITEVAVDDPGILRDIDTEEAYRALCATT